MSDQLSQSELLSGLFLRNPPGSVERLAGRGVAIAGAGGLGSNIAVALVRSGVQRLIIADFDRVELSNLNRQHYFLDQLGQPKVKALAETLLRINPHLDLVCHELRVTEANLVQLFGSAEILVEAFDRAEAKAMAVRTWLGAYPDRYVITGSGLAGYGRSNHLSTTIRGRLVICGDQEGGDLEVQGLCAPRLGIVAQQQANAVLEILLTGGLSVRSCP